MGKAVKTGGGKTQVCICEAGLPKMERGHEVLEEDLGQRNICVSSRIPGLEYICSAHTIPPKRSSGVAFMAFYN